MTNNKMKNPLKNGTMKYDEIVILVIFAIMVIALAISLVGLWACKDKEMTDFDLYGMDSEEYLKKQVGEDYYNKHYKK